MKNDTFKLVGNYSYIARAFDYLIDYSFIDTPEYQQIIKEFSEDYENAIKKYKSYIYGADYCESYARCASVDNRKKHNTCHITFKFILEYLSTRKVYVIQNDKYNRCGMSPIKKILIRINEDYKDVQRIVIKYNKIDALFKFFDFSTNNNIKNIVSKFIEKYNNNINSKLLEQLAVELGDNIIICCSSSIRQFYDLYHNCLVYIHNIHLFYYLNTIDSDIACSFKIALDQSVPTEYLFFIKVKDEYAHHFDRKVYINEHVIDTANIRLHIPKYFRKEILKHKTIHDKDIISKQFNKFLMEKKCKKRKFTILYDELMSHFATSIDRKNIREFLAKYYYAKTFPDYANELIYYKIGCKKRNAE